MAADEGPENLVLHYLLERIDRKLGTMQESITDLKSRVTGLEAGFAVLS
jgi:hypothetical protein